MIELACPKCTHVNSGIDSAVYEAYGYSPIKCVTCGEVYVVWANVDTDLAVIGYHLKPLPIKEEIPPGEIGSHVIVTNKDHPRNGSLGAIVNKNHKRYRIRFDDGVILWLPSHWVINDHCGDRHGNNGP